MSVVFIMKPAVVNTYFSKRTSHLLTPNPLATKLGELRARGVPVLDLTVSNPTHAGFTYATEAIVAALEDARVCSYEPAPLGIHSAREIVAELVFATYGVRVSAEEIVLTASTSEAYSFLLKLLCDPGDEMLVPTPSYPLFDLLADFENVKLVPYSLEYDGEWHVDLETLRRARTDKTRGIFIVSPNNPTGSIVKNFELEQIAALGLPIIADEVFASYVMAPGDAYKHSALHLEEKHLAFVMGGLSKMAALPQMKLAWTIVRGPREEKRRALERLELLGDTFLSVSTPTQIALEGLLRATRTTVASIQRRVEDNLAWLRNALPESSPISILNIEGGWTTVLRVPNIRTEQDWALELLEKDNVLIHPGHFFNFASEAFVVASLIVPPETFREGMTRIRNRIGS